MDLKDLKKTWNKMPTGQELDEGQLRNMLGKRTKNVIERIDRNIKIGFVVLLALILLFSFDDFWFSPETLNEYYTAMPIPGWVIFLAIFGNILIFTTFIYFVIKYYLVKKKCDVVCNLRDTLKQIIATLELYQRLFYLALAAILLAIVSAFASGIFEGLSHNAEVQGMQISDIETSQLLIVIVISAVIIGALGCGIFFFLRWGFRKLYGNYILKLKTTLKELEEIRE
jgi:hypothetical protein